MHCPRCGTPNEPGDRFCGSCGAQLRTLAPEAAQSPRGGAFSKLVGTTKKARLISAATVIAILVAIAGFVALKPKDEGIPRDSYTVAADHLCMKAKRQIVAAGQEDGIGFARQLVPIVVNWRERLAELHAPSDREERAVRLDAALRGVEIDVATLARITERGNRARILASAKRADAASAEVEGAVSDLGLSECASETIGFSTAK